MRVEQGVRQGDAAGGFFFMLVLIQQLVALREQWPLSRILSYLDDLFVLGKPAQLLAQFDAAKTRLAEIGLNVNAKKSWIYVQTRLSRDLCVQFEERGVTILEDGFRAVGGAYGSTAFIQEHLDQVLTSLRAKTKAVEDATD